jgi:hypothetical protein
VPTTKLAIVGDVTRIGGSVNYTEFEADGTMVANGAATTWNDINIGFAGAKTPAVNNPTWTTFATNLNAYRFAVDDYLEVSALELLHDWKEGTAIELHVHWATNGANDATVRGVKWEVTYTWANSLADGGTTAFATATAQSAESSIAASEPDLTHKRTSVYTLTPTGGKIGAYVMLKIKRIASVTNTAPANNPFGLAVGVHYEKDTLGSRTISSK